ncbi:glycodelin-like isoform X1 [Saimiri boliviensis]|uniref:glycodelin-like isoform X1 n=3 Tax=Saimiri boliviensis TaxID=27679 RepID=UPI00193CCB95|nr:glycodelin-like isoform X3 [Saimiri boliviensis boliviensis]
MSHGFEEWHGEAVGGAAVCPPPTSGPRAHTASASLSLQSSEPPTATVMPCLLYTLGMALVCSIQASDIPQTEQDLEVSKLAGTWHFMAMVSSNLSLLGPRDAPLRIYITSLMPTTEGNLEIILHRWENNSCVEKKVLAEKTENPKNFRINCADMAVNEATLLETDYDKFLFLCLKSTAAPRQSTMCQYLARSLEADAEVLKAFFRAFKTLPVQIWFLLEWYQVPEPCPI